MGLLDDAIREHLEFKRQHGANPNEVARQEHEALGAVDRGENAASTSLPGSSPAPAGGPGEEPAPAPGDALAVSKQDLPHTGEETAELDMRTVLKAESPVPAAAPGPEESLEWEVPGDSSDGKEAEESEEPVDDVLEETPDFLRETPDQDRLWFEQQPPRDFDFDK